ncbi:hypothetical protein N7476_005442, partial [Penicillium atrosanguineum]
IACPLTDDGSSKLAERIHDLINRPPGLPSPHPTVSAWQEPPHPTVGSTQSAMLPTEVDIVIIGSGVTGCGVAHTLLNHPDASQLRVTMLEARNAVSGATGRNGGHLVSNAGEVFPVLVEALGMEEAMSVAHLSERTIARLKEVVAGLSEKDQAATELRSVISTIAFDNNEGFEAAKHAIEYLQVSAAKSTDALPEKIIPTTHATKEWRYSRNTVGAAQQTGSAALWPYRLFTALYQILIEKSDGRFSLETNTPVTSINHDPSAANAAYTLQTPRGSMRARHVIHCTNGHMSHLVPGLVGKLWPIRGTMSRQKLGPSFPLLGNEVSWTWRNRPSFDPSTNVVNIGLYYAQQNVKTGDLWIGGEKQSIEDLLNNDDSVVSEQAKDNLASIVPEILQGVEPVEMIRIWSGIMGLTADGLPLVGQLRASLTGRSGNSEWVAGGYNGHGMDKAWSCGEAIARMVLGEEAPSWMPKSFLLSDNRLAEFAKDDQSLPHKIMGNFGIAL